MTAELITRIAGYEVRNIQRVKADGYGPHGYSFTFEANVANC
jgi:hypothetical protein